MHFDLTCSLKHCSNKKVITDSCSMYSSFNSLQQPPWGNCYAIFDENSAI